MIVYKITNKVNGKCYIGQTVQDFDKRLAQHFSKKDTVIQKAIRKYGKDSFEYVIIDRANNMEQLNSKEEFWINFYKSLTTQNGYNIKKGGKNARLTEEEKLNVSKKTKEALSRPEIRQKLGRTWTKEEKERKSNQMKGRKLSKEHRESISKALKGKKKSKEHAKNIAKGKTGIKYNIVNRPSKYNVKPKSKEYILKQKEKLNKNRREKRKYYSELFKQKGRLDYIVCDQNNKKYTKYSDAAKELGINVCGLREHVMGMYSNCGGYTFKAYFKTLDNEGDK